MSMAQTQQLIDTNYKWESQFTGISDGIWFGPNAKLDTIENFGVKNIGGGALNSKTIMYRELETLLRTGMRTAPELRKAAIEDNALNKATHNTRTITYGFLSKLYGLTDQPPLTQLLFRLWDIDASGRRLLSLLVALARDPLFRQTATVIFDGAIGSRLNKSVFANLLEEFCSDRYGDKSIQSISRNCASSWTQSGHLKGSRDKIRQRVSPTPHSVALAGTIATFAGFSGPSTLNSGWFKILDLNFDQALNALGRAEAIGLAEVRSFGEVIEISISRPISATLGVSSIEKFQ